MQITMFGSHFTKLSAKYCGPYQVLQKVEHVAYKLSLHPKLLLHPTFHVSQLKRCYELLDTISHPPVLELPSPYYPQHTKFWIDL